MAQVLEDIRAMTIADFEAFLTTAPEECDYELIDGVIVIMTNPTETHEQITSNLGASLKLAMDRRGCRTCQGGMRVQLGEDFRAGNSYRRDVLVRCGASGNKTCVHPLFATIRSTARCGQCNAYEYRSYPLPTPNSEEPIIMVHACGDRWMQDDLCAK